VEQKKEIKEEKERKPSNVPLAPFIASWDYNLDQNPLLFANLSFSNTDPNPLTISGLFSSKPPSRRNSSIYIPRVSVSNIMDSLKDTSEPAVLIDSHSDMISWALAYDHKFKKENTEKPEPNNVQGEFPVFRENFQLNL